VAADIDIDELLRVRGDEIMRHPIMVREMQSRKDKAIFAQKRAERQLMKRNRDARRFEEHADKWD